MQTLLVLLGVLAALFLAAALATREQEALAPAPPDRADVVLPPGPLRPADVQGVRFGLALRGYRMSEVDAVLDRLAAELAERDRLVAELTGATASSGGLDRLAGSDDGAALAVDPAPGRGAAAQG